VGGTAVAVGASVAVAADLVLQAEVKAISPTSRMMKMRFLMGILSSTV
jgi:hypothetical protein